MELHYVSVVILCLFAFAESRQGWKTNGNGFFVYKASTNFSGTGNLQIAGKFSTVPYSQIKNVLLAVEDASGNLTFQYSIVGGKGEVNIRQGSYMQSVSSNIVGGNVGYLFSFTLSVSQTRSQNGSYNHNVNPSLSAGVTTVDNIKWDLDNMTLYIGGYRKVINSGAFFQGCLSDFTFKGVDIINTYFQQYPNNTNPVKGSLTVGSFSNAAQTCNDVMSTVKPTNATTIVTPTTTSNGIQNIASFSWLFFFAFNFAIFWL